MRRMTWAGLVAALMVAQAATAQTDAALTIEGTSTLRSWSCDATGFTVTPRPPRGFEGGVLQREKTLETVTVRFEVDAIECGNETMNEHLRKALKADAHPQIVYSMTAYEIEGADVGITVAADGLLNIAGAERPIRMDVTVDRHAAGGIRVTGEREIRMTDFGVQPPKLMLGTLKVGDVVRVKFDMPLRPHPAAVAGANQNNDD